MKKFRTYLIEADTTLSRVVDKQYREKGDLEKRQDREKENARRKDFNDRERERANKRQQANISKRSTSEEAEIDAESALNEYQEVGTDETTAAAVKAIPGQKIDKV